MPLIPAPPTPTRCARSSENPSAVTGTAGWPITRIRAIIVGRPAASRTIRATISSAGWAAVAAADAVIPSRMMPSITSGITLSSTVCRVRSASSMMIAAPLAT